MTKKNLKPQQAAPVQREINTASSVGGTGLTPSYFTPAQGRERAEKYGLPADFSDIAGPGKGDLPPFAGDDAE